MVIYHWRGKIATLHSLQKNHLTLIIHLHTLREESNELKDCTQSRRSAPPTQKRKTIKLNVAKQPQTLKTHQTQKHWFVCYFQAANFYFELNENNSAKLKRQWQHGVRIHCHWTFGNLELTVEPLQVFSGSCALWRSWASFVAGRVDNETCYLARGNEGSHNNESQYFCCANFLPPSHFSSSSAGGPAAPSTSHLLVRKLLLIFSEFSETTVTLVHFTQMAAVNF